MNETKNVKKLVARLLTPEEQSRVAGGAPPYSKYYDKTVYYKNMQASTNAFVDLYSLLPPAL